jgi:hypothetical protein
MLAAINVAKFLGTGKRSVDVDGRGGDRANTDA